VEAAGVTEGAAGISARSVTAHDSMGVWASGALGAIACRVSSSKAAAQDPFNRSKAALESLAAFEA